MKEAPRRLHPSLAWRCLENVTKHDRDGGDG